MTEIAAICADFRLFEPGSWMCWLNEMFRANPALGFMLGLAVPPLTWAAQFVFLWLRDSGRWLSGKWLLCILDEDGKPFKYDLYRLRQRRNSVTGKIRRLVSMEDAEQTARRYGLRGYATESDLVYSFWPLSKNTPSFGTCTLSLVKDNQYEGLYTRPYEEDRNDGKEHTAKIVLTRSSAKVRELVARLESDERRYVWRRLFGWFSRMDDAA